MKAIVMERRVRFFSMKMAGRDRVIRSVMIVCCLCGLSLTTGGRTALAVVKASVHDLNFIHYNGDLQPYVPEQSAFLPWLDVDLKNPHNDPGFQETIADVTKKFRVQFSPRVVMKPFFIVDEVKDLLLIMQSRLLENNVLVDRNFQAKTALSKQQMSQLKRIKQYRPVSVSPYQNRTYGLHLQITW